MSETKVHTEDPLRPAQHRALIQLAFLGGQVPKAGDLKPGLDAALRKKLVDRKLLTVGPINKKGLQIALDDAGWRWVMDNLTEKLPVSEHMSTAILSRLSDFLKVNGITVQDVIQARRLAVGETVAPRVSPEQALLTVALELGGGRISERILLRDIRPKMEHLGYSRASVDKAIRDLQLEETLSVIPIDLPTDIDDRDQAAAVDIAGVRRHALILRRRSSSDSDR